MARKNPLKSALILAAFALGIVLLAVFVLKPYQDKQKSSETKSTVLFSIERDKIVDLKIENPSGALHLTRRAEDNKAWFITTADGKSYEADTGSVDGILSTLLAAKKEADVKAGTELAPFGLQQPRFKLIINDGLPNKQPELQLGEDTPVDYLVYAKWGDKPEVFSTTRSLRFGLDKQLKDLRVKKIFDTPIAAAEKIEIQTIASPKAPSTKIHLEKKDGAWVAVGRTANKVDASEVDRYLKIFKDMAIVNFTSEAGTERSTLGFAKPVARLKISYKDKGEELKVHEWALAKARDPETQLDKWYWSELGREASFEVAETFKDNFLRTVDQFRPRAITSIDENNIQSLVITDTRTTVELTKASDGWKVNASDEKGSQTLKGKKEPIDAAIKAISKLEVEEFLDPVNLWPLGLKTPSRMVEIRGKKDGKDNELLANLVFGKKMKDADWVVRAEGMDSPASTRIDLDGVLPVKAEVFGDTAVAGATATSGPASTPEKGKKVKLEPTVQNTKEIKKLPAPITKAGKKYSAVITLDNGKEIELTFDAAKAPYTVSNFLHLARNGYYNDVKFHRVIQDFVAQGGDPTGSGRGGPGYQFEDEQNDLTHQPGVISMANAGPNTNGSQFFLVHKAQPHLNGKHTVFGQITRGMEDMLKIKVGDTMKKVEVFEESL